MSFAVGGQLLTLRGLAGEVPGWPLSLHGAHQAQNAVVSSRRRGGVLRRSASAAEDVVRTAFEAVRSPGRLEVVRTEPLTIPGCGSQPARCVRLRLR